MTFVYLPFSIKQNCDRLVLRQCRECLNFHPRDNIGYLRMLNKNWD